MNSVDVPVWVAIASAGITFAAVVVSVLQFVSQRREKRRQLKVEVSNGFLNYGPKLSELMLFITMANPGRRDVTVNSPYFIMPDRRSLALMRPTGTHRFPHVLRDGKSCQIWIPARAIAAELLAAGYVGKVKVRGACRDAVGVQYLSKPFPVNVHELLRT